MTVGQSKYPSQGSPLQRRQLGRAKQTPRPQINCSTCRRAFTPAVGVLRNETSSVKCPICDLRESTFAFHGRSSLAEESRTQDFLESADRSLNARDLYELDKPFAATSQSFVVDVDPNDVYGGHLPTSQLDRLRRLINRDSCRVQISPPCNPSSRSPSPQKQMHAAMESSPLRNPVERRRLRDTRWRPWSQSESSAQSPIRRHSRQFAVDIPYGSAGIDDAEDGQRAELMSYDGSQTGAARTWMQPSAIVCSSSPELVTAPASRVQLAARFSDAVIATPETSKWSRSSSPCRLERQISPTTLGRQEFSRLHSPITPGRQDFSRLHSPMTPGVKGAASGSSSPVSPMSVFAQKIHQTQKVAKVFAKDARSQETPAVLLPRPCNFADVLAAKKELGLSGADFCMLRDIFRRYDIDASGGLSLAKFDAVLNELRGGAPPDKDFARSCILGSVKKTFRDLLEWFSASGFREEVCLSDDQQEMRTFSRSAGIDAAAVESAQEYFKQYVGDTGCEMTMEHFRTIVRRLMGVPASMELPGFRMKYFWTEANADMNQSIDFEEFMQWFLRHYNPSSDRGWTALFEDFYVNVRPCSVRRDRDVQKQEQQKQEQQERSEELANSAASSTPGRTQGAMALFSKWEDNIGGANRRGDQVTAKPVDQCGWSNVRTVVSVVGQTRRQIRGLSVAAA